MCTVLGDTSQHPTIDFTFSRQQTVGEMKKQSLLFMAIQLPNFSVAPQMAVSQISHAFTYQVEITEFAIQKCLQG
jgi:hypothetical protein